MNKARLITTNVNAFLTSYEKYNMTIVNCYHNNNRVNSNGDIKIPSKKFTKRRKQEILEHYLLTENYAETPVTKLIRKTKGRNTK